MPYISVTDEQLATTIAALETCKAYLPNADPVRNHAIDDALAALKEHAQGQAGQDAPTLHEAATAALGWIDEIYPPDIFIGKSEDADEGVKMIAKIREELRQALRQRPGDAAE